MSSCEQYRVQYVPCSCNVHNGEMVHYKQRQRCLMRPSLNGGLAEMSTSDEEEDLKGQDDLDFLEYLPFDMRDEVDRLCFELYANHIDSKTTEESVTQTLRSIHNTIGKFLPELQRQKLPRTFKQLRSIFAPHLLALR